MSRWLRFVPALALMGLIWRASATPGLQSVPLIQRLRLLPLQLDPAVQSGLEWGIRKSVHLLSFGLLALLLLWALTAWLPERRRAIRTAFAITLAYAGVDELHQSFVPDREGRLLDVGIDALGAALALWLSRRQDRSEPRKGATG